MVESQQIVSFAVMGGEVDTIGLLFMVVEAVFYLWVEDCLFLLWGDGNLAEVKGNATQPESIESGQLANRNSTDVGKINLCDRN
jgi:hypothetical protein